MIIPDFVVIETSAVCNLKCKDCMSLNYKPEVPFMSFDVYKSVIDRSPENSTIVPWMNGEPFLNPDFAKIIAYTNSIHRKNYITTNGTIFDEHIYKHIFSKYSHTYQIVFSLDGHPTHYKSSAEILRPGSNRETVYHSILKAVELKKEMKSDTDICVKCIRKGQDFEEIESFIYHFLFKVGVDYVDIGSVFSGTNEESLRIYPCQYLTKYMLIRTNGDLVICMYNTAACNEKRFSPGNVFINNKPLVNLYNNDAYTDLRECQKRGVFHYPCFTCSFPYTGSGFFGKIFLRNPPSDVPIYFHQDYYNQYFSLKEKRKSFEYYNRR